MSIQSRALDYINRVAAEFKALRKNELGNVRRIPVTKSQYAVVVSHSSSVQYLITDWEATTDYAEIEDVADSGFYVGTALVEDSTDAGFFTIRGRFVSEYTNDAGFYKT